MSRSPIPRCIVCNRAIVRMVKVQVWDGYYLKWSQAKYCSQKCIQRAYRRRKKAQKLIGLGI